MARKCTKCGVPLEGFLYDWVASKIFGIRPSTKSPGLCNKCEGARAQGVQGAKEKEVGKVTHYYNHLNVAIVELNEPVKVGDKIHVKGHTDDFVQDIASMQIEHAAVSAAKAGDLIGIKVMRKVHPNDKVYKC